MRPVLDAGGFEKVVNLSHIRRFGRKDVKILGFRSDSEM